MARVWITYREGSSLFGGVVTTVPLERAVALLDIAPWRYFSATGPQAVGAEAVESRVGRKRVLLEVSEGDLRELGGYRLGFYDSPYSPVEARRRLGVEASSAAGAIEAR